MPNTDRYLKWLPRSMTPRPLRPPSLRSQDLCAYRIRRRTFATSTSRRTRFRPGERQPVYLWHMLVVHQKLQNTEYVPKSCATTAIVGFSIASALLRRTTMALYPIRFRRSWTWFEIPKDQICSSSDFFVSAGLAISGSEAQPACLPHPNPLSPPMFQGGRFCFFCQTGGGGGVVGCNRINNAV